MKNGEHSAIDKETAEMPKPARGAQFEAKKIERTR